MKRLGKWLLILTVVLAIGVVSCTRALSKKLPAQIDGDADIVATKMLDALGKPQWDSLNYLGWTFFGGGHHYLWDKQNNVANIKWKDVEVIYDLDGGNAKVIQDGSVVTGDAADKLKQKAWGFWCNDSFWMFAPFKAFDKGVSRSLVATEEAPHGLLVSYKSGGVTPGDKYLWLLDDNYRPIAWRMYVKVLPVKGMYTSWDRYKSIDGLQLSTQHGMGKMQMELTNVRGGQSLSDIQASAADFSLK